MEPAPSFRVGHVTVAMHKSVHRNTYSKNRRLSVDSFSYLQKKNMEKANPALENVIIISLNVLMGITLIQRLEQESSCR